MSVTAVTGASLWDSVNFPANLSTAPVARRGVAVAEGTPASGRAVPAHFGDDSYTPGVRTAEHTQVQSPSNRASNALNLAGLTGSGSSVNLATLNLQGAALVNGSPLLLLGGANGAASSAAGSGTGQAQAGRPSTAEGEVMSQLDAAISAAATDGSQDSNWMDDLVSYASGLDGGATSAGGAGGALSSDLNAIEGVIQRVTAQVSSALAAQGASPSLLSAAVNALSTSLTLNSLGAVAQQIAARTGNPNTFTVTSSVVTISSNGANGANSTASVAGQQESFSGANGNLALATTDGTASFTSGNGAQGNGASVNSEGFGYSFAISESGPGGNAFAGTSEVEAVASATSNNGAGGSASSTAALAEGATVYESASGSGGANNSAMVLMSDWEATLESTATQNTANSAGDANAAPAAQEQPVQSATRSLADFFNLAAHALFKHAVALLESLFGVGSSDGASQTGNGHVVDVYA